MSSTFVHCKVCNVKFESNHILLSHINLHIGRKCTVCNKFFTSTIPENSLISNDNKCKESHLWISQQSLLKQSQPSPPPTPTTNLPKYVRKYPAEMTLQCAYCAYNTFSNTRFKKHMRCHTNERPYKCDKCDKAFTVRCNLKQHISSVHTKEKRFKCKYCGNGFIRSDRLKEHERIHTGETPLKCPFCEQKFATSGRLNKHKKKHTGYKCRFCAQMFKTEYQLKQHKKAQHFEIISNKSNYIVGKRWFPFGCKFCGLRFLEKDLLDKHIPQHDGKICPKCNKLFATKEKVQQHEIKCEGIKIEKNEIKIKRETDVKIKIRNDKLLDGKKHYCMECDRCFPSGQSLGGHRASFHSKRKKNKAKKSNAKKKTPKKRKIVKKKSKFMQKKERKVYKTRSKNKKVVDENKDFMQPTARKCGPDYLRHFDILFNETEHVHNIFDKNEIVKNAYIETEGVLPNIDINDKYMNNNNNMENEYDFDFNDDNDDDLYSNENGLEYLFDNDIIIREKHNLRKTRMTRAKKKESERLKSGKDCPGRHGLIKTMTADNRVFECIECNKTMYLNEELFRCKWCDYDLCSACFNECNRKESNECKTMSFDYVENKKENETERKMNVNKNNKKRKHVKVSSGNLNKTTSAPLRKRRKLIIRIPRLKKNKKN